MPFLLNKRLMLTSLAVATSMALSSVVVAQTHQEAGFTFAPSFGYYNFDGDRNAKDETAFSVGLGYRFNNPWGVELVYLNADSEDKRTRANIDARQYRLDALYHLTSDRNFTPYLAAGVGFMELSPGKDNALLNLGAGVKYALSEMVSLRGDFRLIDDVEDNRIDNVTTLGLHFAFGGKSTSPETAIKAAPLVVPVAFIDSDGDGVADANDQCPGTPAGVQVDAKGCALDDDQDGVPNYLDACPDTAAGKKVDARGCSLVLEIEKPVSLAIYFATNLATINKEYYSDIKEVAAYLEKYPKTTIVIEGHTDSAGAAAYNKTLSKKRAQATADVLVKELNIEANRVSVVGYGAEKPLIGNATEEQRRANRRVVAIISAE